jgi:hypothetical protein
VTEAAAGSPQLAPIKPRRYKSRALIATILLSALTLLTWTGEWFSLGISGGGATKNEVLSITGDVAAPGLVALALAGLALAAALAIAGPFFRYVLGILQILLGFTVALSSFIALKGPVHAAESAITTATGISGSRAVAALVTAQHTTAWPYLAALFGILTMVVGVFVFVTNRRWPRSSRRYQAVRLEEVEPGTNPVADWDSLSGGSDPTSR